MESKYGESISVKDVNGFEPVKRRRHQNIVGATYHGGGGVELCPAGSRTDGTANTSTESGKVSDEATHLPERRKAPTDSKNEAFEEWLRNRQPRNFLIEQVIRKYGR